MAPPYFRTFIDFGPPASFNGAPFTQALITEAPAKTGTFDLRETIDLEDLPGGLDVDPRTPALRDLTTVAAQLDPPGWFRIDWRHTSGALFPGDPFLYAEPVSLFMTAAEVREESQANFARLGYPEPTPGTSDKLDRRVRAAQGYVEQMTGRTLDETLPAGLVELAHEAVVMRVEQSLGQRSRASVSDLSQGGGLGLKSMRAGDYSETRFDPSEARKARLFNPWAALSEVLWLLATPARRLELLADLSDEPAPVALAVPMVGGYCSPGWAGDGYWP